MHHVSIYKIPPEGDTVPDRSLIEHAEFLANNDGERKSALAASLLFSRILLNHYRKEPPDVGKKEDS